MLAAVYRELGLVGVELRLNSMGCKECRPGYSIALRDFLDSHSNLLCGECRERAQLNPLRTFDCKVRACRQLLDEAPRLPDYLCSACAAHHRQVEHYLGVQGVAFARDHRLVRGLDYYTRTTFEFQSSLLGAQSGVGGGGRYDDLVESIGGPPTPGVGFGTGMERILLALARSGVGLPGPRPPAAYLVALDSASREAAFSLAHEARSLGVAVDLDYMERSPKGQMKQAGRSGARYALIIGEEELGDGTVTVRDLTRGEERRMQRSEALELLSKEV
jgi:histidyl-tRNA synthetase